jgi:hypothetical protein
MVRSLYDHPFPEARDSPLVAAVENVGVQSFGAKLADDRIRNRLRRCVEENADVQRFRQIHAPFDEAGNELLVPCFNHGHYRRIFACSQAAGGRSEAWASVREDTPSAPLYAPATSG